MYKKLCILLIFSKLKVAKLLINKYRMHNLYTIFAKILNICKQIAGNLVNESGNVSRSRHLRVNISSRTCRGIYTKKFLQKCPFHR